MNFVSEVICENPGEKGYWFIFHNNRMLFLEKNGKGYIPRFTSPADIGLAGTGRPLYIGRAEGISCRTAEASDAGPACADADPAVILSPDDFTASEGSEGAEGPEGAGEPENRGKYSFKGVRELYSDLGEEMFALAGRAFQLHNWNKAWKYCPSCGEKLTDSSTERAKICDACAGTYYPVISPAVIVAVTKGDKILLARNNRHISFKRYSILAGFVEAGESLEDTVSREIMEEVSIKVKNIKYFASQSWPFPHSLMLGFTAEYESGEIQVDGKELSHADWFTAESLPDIPPFGSISRVLIEDFKAGIIKKTGMKENG